MATYNISTANQEPSGMAYISSDDNQAKPEATKYRGRKPNKASTTAQKKKPQRGMGVAQLERLRLQERWKKMTEISPLSTMDTIHFQHQYALALPEPIPSFPVMHGALGGCGSGGSGLNSPDLRLVHVGNSLSLVETSKELSSIPKMQQQWPVLPPHERCDVCLKKKRFNGENMAFSGGKDMFAEISLINSSDIPEFNQENNMNFNGGIDSFGARAASSALYTGRTLNEGAEVRAIHRNGNSTGGSVLMEYEFFPGKAGRSTSSKELELPAEASVAVDGEASCFTTTTYSANAASNSVDLSLKLSY